MKKMIYTSKRGKKVVFDDYEREDGSVWGDICESCKKKYSQDIPAEKISEGGSGEAYCSVFACFKKADYYVDFAEEEVRYEYYTVADLVKDKRNQYIYKKFANYLQSRLDDLETDFGKDSEELKAYKNTVLTEKILKHGAYLCNKYYDTMLSSDCDYILNEDYSLRELVELVETRGC